MIETKYHCYIWYFNVVGTNVAAVTTIRSSSRTYKKLASAKPLGYNAFASKCSGDIIQTICKNTV